jgi:hypothetical protein
VKNAVRSGSNRCQCMRGYSGYIEGDAKTPQECTPIACAIPNSNMGQAEACKCLDGFTGTITWNGAVASGECQPAPCNVKNSNAEDGLLCACKAGFSGTITWKGDGAMGTCEQ